MAVPESTVWDRDPHTEAKHLVLRGYFEAWYPIMLSIFPRLTGLEGYAGPGVYTKDEDGSPVIALQALVERAELLDGGRTFRFVFIEERHDRLEKLNEVVGQRFPRLPRGITVDYYHGPCERTWEVALDQADAWGMPIFANLDPFGPGVPYTLIERLGGNKSSEVLVTFMSDWLRKFWSLEELDDGDVQFGSKSWRKVGVPRCLTAGSPGPQYHASGSTTCATPGPPWPCKQASTQRLCLIGLAMRPSPSPSTYTATPYRVSTTTPQLAWPTWYIEERVFDPARDHSVTNSQSLKPV